MTLDPFTQLQQEIQALQVENVQLRHELQRHVAQAEATQQARIELMRGGARLLIPLLDRGKVVQSFARLAETSSEFCGPMSQWPSRERVLGAAREFLESCVRFAIRRRTWLLLFSLIATAIPVIQIWLVVQQNEIIRNQSALLELQVYDIVSRSMTEGDRNARLMTGALLSKADVGFLRGVVEEAFDPNLAGIYREEGVRAQERRLEDAAFRGHLIRAVVRGIENSAEVDRSELFVQTRPMLRLILADAADRVPHVFRLSPGASETDGALAEQVDNYLAQVVRAMQVYARLARTVGEQEAFAVDVRPLLRRLSSHGTTGSGQFEQALGTAFEHFAFEAALELELGDPPVDLDRANLSPDDARRQGLENLRAWVGDEGVAWERLGSIAGDAS